MLLHKAGQQCPVQLTEERTDVGPYQMGTASIQPAQIWDAGPKKQVTGGLESIRSLCVLQYILDIVYLYDAYDTSTAVPGLNNQSSRCDHAHRS